MFLIERYIMSEIRRPLIAILAILVLIFASYTLSRFLNDAADGAMGFATVFLITGYRVLIALEILAPVALYVSAVIGLGRLAHDREMIAISAAGIGPSKTYRAVLLLALPVALAVALLSIYGRPWAYTEAYALEARAQTDLNLGRLQAHQFNINPDSGRMIFAEGVDPEKNRLYDLVIHDAQDDRTRFTQARVGWLSDTDPVRPVLELRDGFAYSLDRQGRRDRIMDFDRLTLVMPPIQLAADYKRKAAATSRLAASASLPDRAELQWRLSRGPVALLLALLAVPLSRSKPRSGRFANLLPVTLVFVVIYYAGGLFKTLVDGGSISALPGVWWVPLLMAGLLAVLMFPWRAR